MKCPKCGFDNNPNNKFCSKCGEQIIKESLYSCPRCGSDVNEEDAFCPSCGWELKWVDADYKHIPVPKAAKNDKKIIAKSVSEEKPVSKVFSYLSLGLMLLATLFLLIGSFGDIAETVVSGSKTSLSTKFTYIFDEGYKAIEPFKDIVKFSYGYNTFLLVLLDVLFIFSIISTVASITLLILKLVKKDFMSDKLLVSLTSIPIVSYAFYLVLIAYRFFMEITSSGSSIVITGSITFGWGTSLIIAGIIIYLVGLLCNIGKGVINDKPNALSIVSLSLGFSSIIFIFIAMLNMHLHTFGISSSTSSSTTEQYISFTNILTQIDTLNYARHKQYLDTPSGYNEALIYAVLVPISTVFILSTFYLLITKKKLPALISLVVSFAIYLIGAMLVLSKKKDLGFNTTSYSFVLFNIFLCIGFVSILLSWIFEMMAKKKSAN